MLHYGNISFDHLVKDGADFLHTRPSLNLPVKRLTFYEKMISQLFLRRLVFSGIYPDQVVWLTTAT